MAATIDTFTDTDGTDLASHTADDRSTWSKHPSYSSNVAEISSNRLAVRTTGADNHYVNSAAAQNDYNVSFDVYMPGSTTVTSYLGVLLRLDASAFTCYKFVLAVPTSGAVRVEIYRYSNNSATQIGTAANLDTTPASAKTYACQVTLTGTAYEFFVDGVSKRSGTDSNISSGKLGVGVYSSGAVATSAKLDNLTDNRFTIMPRTSYVRQAITRAATR